MNCGNSSLLCGNDSNLYHAQCSVLFHFVLSLSLSSLSLSPSLSLSLSLSLFLLPSLSLSFSLIKINSRLILLFHKSHLIWHSFRLNSGDSKLLRQLNTVVLKKQHGSQTWAVISGNSESDHIWLSESWCGFRASAVCQIPRWCFTRPKTTETVFQISRNVLTIRVTLLLKAKGSRAGQSNIPKASEASFGMFRLYHVTQLSELPNCARSRTFAVSSRQSVVRLDILCLLDAPGEFVMVFDRT